MKITDNNYISFVKKKNFLDMTRQELRMFFFDIGEKIFHADQVMKWIYHYYCSNFDCMTNISKKLRIKLNLLAEIKAPKIVEEYKSVDGTMKWSVQVDNQKVEMVYIPEKNRSTVCISSQVGCKLRCSFCFTGKQGFNRNLKVSEIIGQVWNVGKRLYLHNKNKRNSIITNVVLMGMGEPLLNLSNVISSIRIMLDDFGFGLSKQHITISTAGIAPAIDKLIGVIDVGLAISLHAPNNSLRNNIMPINRKYNIEVLFAAIRRYLLFSHANRGGVTIEYVMIGDINDSLDHAYQLGLLLKNIRCKVNLIPWNSFSGARYVSSSENRIKEFSKILIFYGLVTIVRKTRGDDIGAACGQLSGEVINLYRFFPHPL